MIRCTTDATLFHNTIHPYTPIPPPIQSVGAPVPPNSGGIGDFQFIVHIIIIAVDPQIKRNVNIVRCCSRKRCSHFEGPVEVGGLAINRSGVLSVSARKYDLHKYDGTNQSMLFTTRFRIQMKVIRGTRRETWPSTISSPTPHRHCVSLCVCGFRHSVKL